MPEASFSLNNRTRGKVPRVMYREIKNSVLGKKYVLSVVLITPREAKKISRKTKRKNTPSNVLSFPLSRQSGELLLCPETARRQAPKYGLDTRTFVARLFIHGCLHLKGVRHGATMDCEEVRVAKRFGFSLEL